MDGGVREGVMDSVAFGLDEIGDGGSGMVGLGGRWLVVLFFDGFDESVEGLAKVGAAVVEGSGKGFVG